MQLLFFHKSNSQLLRWFVTESPCRDSFISALAGQNRVNNPTAGIIVPEDWINSRTSIFSSIPFYGYDKDLWRIPVELHSGKHEDVFVNCGQASFRTDQQYLEQIFNASDSDVLTISIDSELSAFSEIIRLTPDRHIVGFRRFYETSVEPLQSPVGWPAITCFRKKAWKSIVQSDSLNINFEELMDWLNAQGMRIEHLRVGGECCQLDNTSNILTFIQERLPSRNEHAHPTNLKNGCTLIEPVWIGNNVQIDPSATIIGPAVLADQIIVEADAIVRSSVLGPEVKVSKGQVVNKSIRFMNDFPNHQQSSVSIEPLLLNPSVQGQERDKYRNWAFFSYANFFKRVFDILVSAFVLILLLPLFPVFIILVKWKSPGPVFYRARRQGLHGREFDCLKFRTMILEAEEMQQQLRAMNQVDGPQFKMDNDPRVSATGKFLRDTCIDELPQFINVLLGQMSIVGPRPSPESENESRPMWRDARLSVRPGITGPWQIFRTRQPSMDFQEWVYYDTRYVRNLTFQTDIYICLKTAQKMINMLLDQFG